MKIKILLILLTLLLSANPLWAKVYNDVPANHWAEKSLIELKEVGIKLGYPNGSFKGKNNLTRYEAASFMNKINSKFKLKSAIREKLAAEYLSEIAPLKEEIKQYKFVSKLYTQGEAEYRFGLASIANSSSGRHGPVIGYRLKYSVRKNYSQESYLSILLDTVDSGMGGLSSRSFPTAFINIYGVTKIEDLTLKAEISPGPLLHRDSGIIPAEDHTIYFKPRASVIIESNWKGWDIATSYTNRSLTFSGYSNINEMAFSVQNNFGSILGFKKVRSRITPSYIFNDFTQGSLKDLRAEIEIGLIHSSYLKNNVILGVNSFKRSPHGLMVNFQADLKDYIYSGSLVSINFHKIGSEFRQGLDQYALLYLNYFNRMILDGTCDLGVKFNHQFNEELSLEYTGDISLTSDFQYGKNYDGTYMINEIAFVYNYNDNYQIRYFYQYFDVPSQQDQFVQLSNSSYDFLGASLKYYF